MRNCPTSATFSCVALHQKQRSRKCYNILANSVVPLGFKFHHKPLCTTGSVFVSMFILIGLLLICLCVSIYACLSFVCGLPASAMSVYACMFIYESWRPICWGSHHRNGRRHWAGGPPLCLGVVSPSFVSRCWSVNARLLNELVLDVRNIITKKTRTHHLLLG